MSKPILHQHLEDRRRCLNCGCYRNWRLLPECPCGWPRGKNFKLMDNEKEVNLSIPTE